MLPVPTMAKRSCSGLGRLVLAGALLGGVPIPLAAAAPTESFADVRAEGDRLAVEGDDAAALEAWRRAYGRVPEGPEAESMRIGLMLDIGRAERRMYASTNDAAHLRKAAAALQWVVEHDLPREGEAPEAAPRREQVSAELAEVQEQLALVESATVSPPAPIPVDPGPSEEAPAVAPVPAPVLVPASSYPDQVLLADLERRRKTANGVAVAGAVFTGLGGATWLLLSLPAVIAASVAEDRASGGALLAPESELYARAARRRRFARTTFWVGLGAVTAGGIMMGAGFGTRARLDREIAAERRKLLLVPSISPMGASGTLVLRF